VAGCDRARGFGSDGLCGGFLGSQGYGGCCMAGLPEMGRAFYQATDISAGCVGCGVAGCNGG
jgi:hypothetical protein